MAGLTIQSLEKSYGATQILQNINLQVEDGEFVVLVGPSGCGKSTLLRTIAGLEPMSSGELMIGGRSMNAVPARHRNIGMVFQSYALFPHMSVRKNISFGMEVRGASPFDAEQQIRRAAEILNLDPYLDRYPRDLSGGQRQRVAMGRAIVREPVLYLMDEPLSNLDAQLRVKMRAEIKSLHQRLGNTIVYVTHDQVEAMTLADRLVVMRGGKIEQEGRPLDIFDRPVNAFVAEFLGSPSINLLKGDLRSNTASIATASASWTLVGERPDGPVLLGIRPADCRIADNGIPAKVTLVEDMGTEAILHLETAQGAVRVAINGRSAHRPGDRVHVDLTAEAIHCFSTGDDACRI